MSKSNTMSEHSPGQPIEDLQARVTFQEDALQQLNQVVASQSQQIDRLEQQLQLLAAKYRDLRHAVEEGAGDAGSPVDERPPHY